MQSLIFRTISCFCLLLIVSQVDAQIRDKTIFHYKDGSVFIGTILEENSKRASLHITTDDTISISKVLIKKAYRDILYFPNGKFHFRKGMFINYALGFGGNGSNVTSIIDLVVGKHYTENLDIGLGMGLQFQEIRLASQAWTNNQYLNATAYARYYPWSKKVRPFVSAALGYGFSLEQPWQQTNRYNGGIYFEPSIGVKFAARRMARTAISIGQTFQRTNGIFTNTDFLGNAAVYDYKLWLNRIVFKVSTELH